MKKEAFSLLLVAMMCSCKTVLKVRSYTNFKDKEIEKRFFEIRDSGELNPASRIEKFGRLLEKDPWNPLISWEIADIARENGLEEKGRSVLSTIPEAPRLTALARMKEKKDPRKAMQLLNRVLTKYKDYYPALYLKGRLLFASGRIGEAGDALARCLELQPKWPPALFELARVRISENAFREASKCLKEYLHKRNSDHEARMMRIKLLLGPLKDIKKARREIGILKRSIPGDPMVKLLEANLLDQEGKSRESERLYQSLIGDRKVGRIAAYNLGLLRMKVLKDKEGAIKAFKKFLEYPGSGNLADVLDRIRARVWILKMQEEDGG